MERKEATEKLIASIHKETRAAGLFVHTISEITGIHSTDIRCLEFLSEAHTATAGELGRATGLTTGAVTAMIDRLEHGGFVRREADSTDRRKTVIRLLGIPDKLKSVRTMFSKQIPDILSGYSTAELQLIANWNMKMAAVFHEKIRNLKTKD
jgi:DNA-binding MarR family transcriptional regulator